MPLHIQVSSCSPKALQLVEAAGGSVERVYYTRLGLKALLKVRSGQRQWIRSGGLHTTLTSQLFYGQCN